MPSKLPFYSQETPDSCVPACLRMVLAGFGVEIEERELHTLTIPELRSLLADGHFPIVFVDLRPIDGVRDVHALVVISINQQEITLLDPLKGERVLPLQTFVAAWAMRHRLAIIVKR